MAELGRPTLYSDDLADIICERVVMRPLYQVAQDEDMPCESSIYLWLGKYDYFSQKYARARGMRAFRRAEEVDRIIEDLRAKEIDPSTAKVMLDAVKWQAGRELPKVFGDRMQVAGEEDAPLTVVVRKMRPDGD